MLLKHFGAVLVAGPKARVSVERPDIRPGAVFLLEAHTAWVEERARDLWCNNFALVSKVPNSSPPRVGGPIDDVRAGAVCFGMLLVVGLAAVPAFHVDLHIIGVVVLCFYLLIRAISAQRMYSVVKADILLVIVSAIAFGDALQETGVVDKLAGVVVSKAKGSITIMFAVYALAAVLGAFINNSAVVAILAPMLGAIVDADDAANPEALSQILLLSASACFVTPLGYQTNLMVMPVGNYSFADFARFGSFIQLAHMLLSIGLVSLMAPVFN